MGTIHQFSIYQLCYKSQVSHCKQKALLSYSGNLIGVHTEKIYKYKRVCVEVEKKTHECLYTSL